jgi:hypothetical protein
MPCDYSSLLILAYLVFKCFAEKFLVFGSRHLCKDADPFRYRWVAPL